MLLVSRGDCSFDARGETGQSAPAAAGLSSPFAELDPSMTADRFAIACHTSWFWDSWRNAQLPGEWLAIRAPEELQLERLEAFDPRLILFPHWS